MTTNSQSALVEQRLPQPDPDATILIRLATQSFAAGAGAEPMAWVMSQKHPLVAEAKIVRMYLREDGGVDVYWTDGKMFLRTFIPERAIIFFDEVMSDDTFVAFIEQAESEEEEEPEDPEEPEAPEEPGHEPVPSPIAANEPGPTA